MATKYQVIDLSTKEIMGTRATRKSARNRADKLDMEYGSYRYGVRAVDMHAAGITQEVVY